VDVRDTAELRSWVEGAAAALGGIDTWQRVAGELFPVLSNADGAGDLQRALWAGPEELAAIAEARDAELARDLRGS